MASAKLAPYSTAHFYLNAKGTTGRYQIFRFGERGLAMPERPVIGAHNDGGAAHVAWPSALQLPDGRIRLYAGRHDDQFWNDLCAWESTDGVDFRFAGVVFDAAANRGRRIGRARVYFVAGSRHPFKMLYTDALNPLAKEIALATSPDGLRWERQGTVCGSTEAWEAAGMTATFVVQASDNEWVLIYHAFETLRRAHAAMAVGPSPEGPFAVKAIIMSPVVSSAGVSGLRRGADHGVIDGDVRIGEPYVLRTSDSQAYEPVVPIARDAATVYFDRPVCADYPEGELRHLAYSKVNASCLWRSAEGWTGYWTGHGQFGPTILSEYTFAVRAGALAGPWRVDPSGVAFSPWSDERCQSTENPTPLQVIS